MTAAAGPRYERIGECCGCGDCCRGEACPHFIDGGGTGRCADYECRPWGCAAFPESPPIVFRRCSYRFRDKWEGRLIGPLEV
jgi:hypothetical protein